MTKKKQAKKAGSLRAAVLAIGKPPQPEPKRRGRKLLIVIVLAIAGLVVAKEGVRFGRTARHQRSPGRTG